MLAHILAGHQVHLVPLLPPSTASSQQEGHLSTANLTGHLLSLILPLYISDFRALECMENATDKEYAINHTTHRHYIWFICCRQTLGGLLASSYRQHQESLAAERERRRLEREERLHRIEREERSRFRFMPFLNLLLRWLERGFNATETGARLKFSYLTRSFCQGIFYTSTRSWKYLAHQSRAEFSLIRHSRSCFPNFLRHLILLWSLLSHCEKIGFLAMTWTVRQSVYCSSCVSTSGVQSGPASPFLLA